MQSFGKRFGRFAARLALALVAVEVTAFLLCLSLQWIESRKYDKSPTGPKIGTLIERTGIFYQNQLAKSVYRPNPLLTYGFRPGISFHNVEYPDQHKENTLWVSRATGFVKNNSDPNDPELIRAGVPLIVVTGGSTVAGDDLSRNEHTVPSRLEAWLRERCREAGVASEVRVLNAGVSGYNATQETSFFLYDLAFYNPRAWIQLTGINEAWHLGMLAGSTELHFNKITRNFPLPDPGAPWNFFPATQKLFLHWIPLALGRRASIGQRWPTERPDQVGSTAARFLKTIAEGSGAAAAVDVPHFFFLQPTLALDRGLETLPGRRPGSPELAAYWKNAEAFYGEARPSLREMRKRFPRWHDLTGLFAGRDTDNLYFGPRHYTDEGARLVAEEIGRKVWPELRARICPSPAKPR